MSACGPSFIFAPVVIAAYAQKIRALEEGQARCGFDDTVRAFMRFLQNPLALWFSDALEDKSGFLKLTFGRVSNTQNHLAFQALR